MSQRIKTHAAARCLPGAVLAASLAVFGATVSAQTTTPQRPAVQPPAPAPGGYVGDSNRQVVTNPYGLCWHSGTWTPDAATEPCDTVGRPMAAYTPPPVAAPAPAPAPLAAAPAPRPPVLEKVTISSDVLFDFDKATLKDSGKQKLDELADRIKDARVEQVIAVGHADRIASEDYNQKLSEQRAQAVKEYLVQKGLPENQVKIEGKGESEPVTGNECAKLGPETGKNRKLVACLQPDRRVEIEVLGTRSSAVGGAASSTSGGAGSDTSTPKQ
jgi:OOP family OmpA-OmpF porin